MSITFNIENYELVLEAKVLLIPKFRELYQIKDKPFHGSTYLMYVFYIAETGDLNPYVGYSKTQRKNVIKDMLFYDTEYKFDKSLQELINQSIEIYKELNSTPITNLLEAYKEKIHKFTDVITNYTTDDIESIEKVILLIKQSKSMIDGLTSLEERVKKSITEKSKGDASISPLQADNFRLDDIDSWGKKYEKKLEKERKQFEQSLNNKQ